MGYPLSTISQEHNYIRLFYCKHYLLNYLIHKSFYIYRLKTTCVYQGKFLIIVCNIRIVSISRNARGIIYNCNPFTDYSIKKGRFPHIRSSYNGYYRFFHICLIINPFRREWTKVLYREEIGESKQADIFWYCILFLYNIIMFQQQKEFLCQY